MQNKLKQLQYKPLLMLGVILASFFTMAIPVTVSAAEPTIDSKVQKLLYYRMLAACFDEDRGGKVTDIEATDLSKLFRGKGRQGGVVIGKDNDLKTIGYYIDQQDGNIYCEGDANLQGWVSDAFTAVGLDAGDPVGALCSLGYHRDNGSDCNTGDGDFKGPDEIVKRLAAKIGGAPSLDPAMEYQLFLKTYEIGCKAAPISGPNGLVTVKGPPPATGSQMTQAKAQGAIIDYVDPATGILTEDVLFAAKEANDKDKGTYVEENFHSKDFSCKELSDKLTNLNGTNPRAAAFSSYAKANGSQTGGPATGTETEAVDDTTCEGGGLSLSWVICPIINGIANSADFLFDRLIQPLLQTNPISFEQDNSVFAIWNSFRILGNIILIFALFAIIFSQALGINLDAYAVKKIVPRLFASAVLLNLSIYLVSVALDFTNILGAGLKALILSPLASKRTSFKPGNFASLGVLALVTGIFFALRKYLKTKGANGDPGGGELLFGAFQVFLMFVVIPALIAVAMVLITLILRQGLIIFLVIIAPIAFALYALPNTEKYLKKWWDTLFKTLLVYPIIMMIFAISEVLSELIGGS